MRNATPILLVLLVSGLGATQLACSNDKGQNTGGTSAQYCQGGVIDPATNQCLPQAVANEVGPNSGQVAAVRAQFPNLVSPNVLAPSGSATGAPAVTSANSGSLASAGTAVSSQVAPIAAVNYNAAPLASEQSASSGSVGSGAVR